MTGRVVCIGDGIWDHYYFGKVLRICPEAPVPIVRWETRPEARHGGAALVSAQLKEIIGTDNVLEAFGSWSHKHRYYADGHMMLRADNDSVSRPPDYFDSHVQMLIDQPRVEAIVVSDYSKGAMSIGLAEKIVASGKDVFVDAKNSWDWYKGAFCAFPNRYEGLSGTTLERRDWFKHVVRKNQQYGCLVDSDPIPPFRTGALRDPTGAGDVFFAGFVACYMKTKDLKTAAQFANMLAGISVTHIGTHVVRRKEIPISKTEPPKAEEPSDELEQKHRDAMAAQSGDEGIVN